MRFILLFVLTFLPSLSVFAETKDQYIKVILRSIGHEFLLELGDSTSRIFPINKVENKYRMKFETELSFEPDQLFSIVSKVLEKNKFKDEYIIEVNKCETNELVHSFKIGIDLSRDSLMPCKKRKLTKDCYEFNFTLVEKQINSNRSILSYFFYFLILMLLLIVFYKIIRFRYQTSKKSSDLISIGKYLYSEKEMKLIFEKKDIELSSIESDLLLLLLSNENKTLKREYILKIVWGNGADYVGRTLDVFISKLRKKLELDSQIKIINIRGVGYKLIIQ